MKRLIQLLALSLLAIIGSNAATTVAQRLLRADGQPFTGRFRISWPTYLNASGQIVRAGYTTVVLESDGDFSIALAPRIVSPASGPIYTVDYSELRQGTRQTEYWDVPDTVSTLAIAAVVTTTPGNAAPPLTSLPFLSTVGTITTGIWHGTPITVPYGGTGATTLTGVLKGNGTSAVTVVSGTATDCVLVNGSSGSCGSAGVSDGDKGDITVSSSGAIWTIDNLVISNAKVATGIDAVKIADGSVSNTEFQYLDATSSIQTQLGTKAPLASPTFTGTVTIPTGAILGTPASGNATNLSNLPITLTTTGSSGAATYTQATNTLNVPQYAGTSGITVQKTGTGNPNTDGETCTIPSTSVRTLYYETATKETWQCKDTNTWELIPGIADPTLAGTVTLSEAVANGTNYRKLKVSDSLSADLDVKFFEGTAPTDGDCLKATVSGSVVSVEGNGSACGSGSSSGLSGSSAIDFASMGDGVCLDNTFTLTGLTAGQSISIGLPSTLSSSIIATGIASATDTAKIRLCNISGATVDLASLTYSVSAPTAISGSGTINFGNILDGTCATASTFTLTGAAAGTRVSIGPPAGLESGLILRMVVTAADTVSVQPCNFSGADLNPASGTFSAAIL